MRKLFKQIIVTIITWEAKQVLAKHKPFIIAVTGSVGKTSTKDAIFHVLHKTISSRKSRKSFNSEIGIPLTVLGLTNAWSDPLRWASNCIKGLLLALLPSAYPKLLVLEVGADHPGDIARVTTWLKPDIAVVTRLPERPVHVEYFSSPLEVAKEKGKLVRALSEHGVFVANADDPAVIAQKELTRARMLTFGFGETAQVRGSYPSIEYDTNHQFKVPVGMLFRVDWQGASIPVRLRGVLGIAPCAAALAAIAVGLARGESLLQMSEALGSFETPNGRMRLIRGKEQCMIIDDSYNSSPVAAEAALDALRLVEGHNKIALLGDMLELGEYSEEEHWRVGRIAGGFVDELVTVGARARGIAEGAKSAGLPEGKIHSFSTSLEAGTWVAARVAPGDVVLVKGSQGSGDNMIRMERAVKLIMAHPEEAPKHLVRQEKEWQMQYQ